MMLPLHLRVVMRRCTPSSRKNCCKMPSLFNAFALTETEFKDPQIMAIEIKAPSFPESVADGTVATWHKKPGEAVKRDDLIVDIETDKVVLEVLAEADGVLGAIIAEEGATVLSNQVLGSIEEGGAAAAAQPLLHRLPPRPPRQPLVAKTIQSLPLLRAKLAEENGINIASVAGTGKGGRVTKEDVVAAVAAKKAAQPPRQPSLPHLPLPLRCSLPATALKNAFR